MTRANPFCMNTDCLHHPVCRQYEAKWCVWIMDNINPQWQGLLGVQSVAGGRAMTSKDDIEFSTGIVFQQMPDGHFENVLHEAAQQHEKVRLSFTDRLRFLFGWRIKHITHIILFDKNGERTNEYYYYLEITS